MASITMDSIHEQLAKDVTKYLAGIKAIEENPATADATRLSHRLQKALRYAYLADGFDGPHKLINQINDILMSQGSKTGFGQGCATESEEGKEPEFLHVYFIEFDTDRVVAREAVALFEEKSNKPFPA